MSPSTKLELTLPLASPCWSLLSLKRDTACLATCRNKKERKEDHLQGKLQEASLPSQPPVTFYLFSLMCSFPAKLRSPSKPPASCLLQGTPSTESERFVSAQSAFVCTYQSLCNEMSKKMHTFASKSNPNIHTLSLTHLRMCGQCCSLCRTWSLPKKGFKTRHTSKSSPSALSTETKQCVF